MVLFGLEKACNLVLLFGLEKACNLVLLFGLEKACNLVLLFGLEKACNLVLLFWIRKGGNRRRRSVYRFEQFAIHCAKQPCLSFCVCIQQPCVFVRK